jgi:AraC-like DNA-binding protein
MVGRRLVMLPVSVDSAVLVHALRRAWFEGRVECIRRAVRRETVSSALRCAVSRILDERITEKAPEPDEVTLHRSLEALAAACGTNRETLRRASRKCGLDLRMLMHGWRAALVLHERFVEADLPASGVWQTIARRCGYESDSGIRGLMKRELGVGLLALDLGHLHELLDRLESNVAGAESA